MTGRHDEEWSYEDIEAALDAIVENAVDATGDTTGDAAGMDSTDTDSTDTDSTDTDSTDTDTVIALSQDRLLRELRKRGYTESEIHAYFVTGVLPSQLDDATDLERTWFQDEVGLHQDMQIDSDGVMLELAGMAERAFHVYTFAEDNGREIMLSPVQEWASDLGRGRLLGDTTLLAARLVAERCTPALVVDACRWLDEATEGYLGAIDTRRWLAGEEPEACFPYTSMLNGTLLLSALFRATPDEERENQARNIAQSIRAAAELKALA